MRTAPRSLHWPDLEVLEVDLRALGLPADGAFGQFRLAPAHGGAVELDRDRAVGLAGDLRRAPFADGLQRLLLGLGVELLFQGLDAAREEQLAVVEVAALRLDRLGPDGVRRLD